MVFFPVINLIFEGYAQLLFHAQVKMRLPTRNFSQICLCCLYSSVFAGSGCLYQMYLQPKCYLTNQFVSVGLLYIWVKLRECEWSSKLRHHCQRCSRSQCMGKSNHTVFVVKVRGHTQAVQLNESFLLSVCSADHIHVFF